MEPSALQTLQQAAEKEQLSSIDGSPISEVSPEEKKRREPRGPSMATTRFPSQSMPMDDIEDRLAKRYQNKLKANIPEKYDELVSTALQEDTEEFPIYIRIENLKLTDKVTHNKERPLYSLSNLNKFFNRLDSI